MTHVGIAVGEQDAVFEAVAAVLHLGNLQFEERSAPDSSQLKPGAVKHLQAASELLGVNPEGLGKALTTRTRQTVDGECSVARDFMQHHAPPGPQHLLAGDHALSTYTCRWGQHCCCLCYSSTNQSPAVPRPNGRPGWARLRCCWWCHVQHPPAATCVAFRHCQPC